MKTIALMLLILITFEARADGSHEGYVSATDRSELTVKEESQLKRRIENRQLLGKTGSPRFQITGFPRLGKGSAMYYERRTQLTWSWLGVFGMRCRLYYYTSGTDRRFPSGAHSVTAQRTTTSHEVILGRRIYMSTLWIDYEGGQLICSKHLTSSPQDFTLGEVREYFRDRSAQGGNPYLRLEVVGD